MRDAIIRVYPQFSLTPSPNLLIVHNIPISDTSLQEVQTQLNYQDINYGSIRWLSQKNLILFGNFLKKITEQNPFKHGFGYPR